MHIDDLVSRIEARPVSLPLAVPMQTARGTIVNQALVLIRVRTSGGLEGHSYLRCYSERASAPLALLIASLEDFLAGEPLDPGHVRNLLTEEFFLLGVTGLAAMAVSGIDVAVWDIISTAMRQPLWQLLGRGASSPRVYKTLSSMTARGAAQEAAAALEAGFDGIKFKAAGVSVAEELKAISEIGAAVESRIALMIDYNQSLDLPRAMERLDAFADRRLEWIEEPLSADDHQGHSLLRAKRQVPIQLGENCWSSEQVSDCLDGADCVALDLGRIGGISGWLAARKIVLEARRTLSNHAYSALAAQLLTGEDPPPWLEWNDDVGRIMRDPASFEEGRLRLPESPGLGTAWDDQEVRSLGL